MNLFISADDKFMLAAKVMLTSFFVNNTQENHNVYFMYSSVKDENLTELNKLVESFNSKFIPVMIKESDFEGFKYNKTFPILVYYRLLIPQIIPVEEQRALWLDVDLVVNGDLNDFYYQDFEGNYLVACQEVQAPTNLKELGCPPDTTYVNSGVILFNLPAAREYSIVDYSNYYFEHKDHIIWPDQDVINGMFAGKIKIADYKIFNAYVPGFQRRINLSYKHLKEKAKIIHYTRRHKPWLKRYDNPAGKIWDKYYLMTYPKNPLSAFFYLLYRDVVRKTIRFFTPLLRSIRKHL